MHNRNYDPPHSAFSNRKIILASQSPRRRQLLEWAEVNFEVVMVPTDESYPAGLDVDQIPIYIAQQKAYAVMGRTITPAGSEAQLSSADRNSDLHGEGLPPIVIAADTVVVANKKIIGKPRSREDAFEILSVLSGNTHEVITGVCIKGRSEIVFADKTLVAFHELTDEEIVFYIDKYKPYDKAGAYGIQEWIGVTGIRSITGDFYNVMGLPVSRVLQALKTGEL